MRLANVRLVLTTLLAYVLQLTDGCGRTPARTKPSPTTPKPEGSTTPAPGGNEGYHGNSMRQICSAAEIQEAKCLHGGECFALTLADKRSAHCHCTEMWTGVRCEMLDDSFFGEWRVLSTDKVAKAGIAAGVVGVVIIVTVIVVYLVIRKRKQRKARIQNRMSTSGNGHASKALISEKEKGYNMSELDELQKCTDV